MSESGTASLVGSDPLGDVEARVRAVVRDVLALDGDPPSLDVSIRDDLGADSLAQLSLFMALEDEFHGTISEKEAEGLVTLRDVVRFIEARIRLPDS